MKNYEDVDAFLADAKRWQAEMRHLREILLASSLTESVKWGKPCYGTAEDNVAIVQPFKDSVALMFFKGVLLRDDRALLEPPGPNSHAARRIRFTDVESIRKEESTLRGWIAEAVKLARSGAELPEAAPQETAYVAELQDVLTSDAAFREAFEGLTPGRRRAYNLYFAGAKQASTRRSRIEKHRQRIMEGKGLNDR